MVRNENMNFDDQVARGGRLAGGGSVATAIGVPNTDQNRNYNLDSQGNWSSSTTGGTTQTETANAQNQITSISASIVEAHDGDAYGNTFIFTAPGTELRQEPKSRHGEGSPLREFTDDDYRSSYGANDIIYCGYPDNDRQSKDIGTGRFDPETENYYVRNRYYSPVLGRWLTRDSIGYRVGINLYGYVGDGPVNAVDRTGAKWVKLPGVEFCEAYYAGSLSPVPVHAFIFFSGHEYGFFPVLSPDSYGNDLRDMVYEPGQVREADQYSSLPSSPKGLKKGRLYMECFAVEVNDCNVKVGEAKKDIGQLIAADQKSPPHYSYLFNDCLDWARGVIRNGVVLAAHDPFGISPDEVRFVPKK